ncbi:Similar to rRNA-processing protein cgr-1; acc. no. Q7SDA6 [Pyronema omphalodes CBS 100304]|uniref:rRNA-processing protein n=1 Tax=Pyronema omphalodes (strain CBS 100304) TaxID=1076935 RepID=U4LL87_PYROM|nr:Similar to rRNA-processing protein cgr-1; acc. no. Q7SDA6 [Pyronema omphalodes CBS 100304]
MKFHKLVALSRIPRKKVTTKPRNTKMSEVAAATPIAVAVPEIKGARVNGKQWKQTKTQFRPGMASGRKTFEERQVERQAYAAMKAREKEMKDEKIQKKKELSEKLKERREKKEEKERYEKLAAKMHQKKIDRLKRREKRNKALKER